MRKYILLLWFGLLSMAMAKADIDYGYYYRTWTSTIHVAEDNTWTIVEKHDVTFREERHGIYRYIQNEMGANRNVNADGEPSDVHYFIYRPYIHVISATGDQADITDSDENDCTVIRWGNPDLYVHGDKTYGAEYVYQMPDDRITARDYIFHSIVPTGIPTSIGQLRFLIRFEKPLPDDIAQRLQIYCGPRGSERRARVENLEITPTQISGDIFDIEPFEAVSLYAELPEGYFVGTLHTKEWPAKAFFYITIALALLLLYYEMTDHGPSITKTIEFKAPDGITPTLVGKIIDDSTDDIDIAALIPWLAQQGYIEIRDIPASGGLFGSKADVVLTKLKDLPADAPEYQKKVMTLLFYKEDVLFMSKMGDRHTKAQAAKNAVNKIFEGDKQLTVYKHTGLMIMLMLSSMLCIMLSSPVKLWYTDNIIAGVMWVFSFLAAWFYRLKLAERSLFMSGFKKTLYYLGRLLAFALVCLVIYVNIFDGTDSIISSEMMLVMALICYVVCELSGTLVHDTPYRTEMIGKLKGFNEFIATAEKDKLRMLVDENPSYFYDVLPYAMVFGLTEKWTDLFRDIHIEQASWYVSTSPNLNSNFYSSINHLSSSISSAIATSAVDHSSSSGGGGGGFSGGGGGGGGGGSW